MPLKKPIVNNPLSKAPVEPPPKHLVAHLVGVPATTHVKREGGDDRSRAAGRRGLATVSASTAAPMMAQVWTDTSYDADEADDDGPN